MADLSVLLQPGITSAVDKVLKQLRGNKSVKEFLGSIHNKYFIVIDIIGDIRQHTQLRHQVQQQESQQQHLLPAAKRKQHWRKQYEV